MSFKNNGNKRDVKYVIGAVFLVIVALCLLPFAATKSGTAMIAWYIIAVVIGYFGVVMFRNSNE